MPLTSTWGGFHAHNVLASLTASLLPERGSTASRCARHGREQRILWRARRVILWRLELKDEGRSVERLPPIRGHYFTGVSFTAKSW